MSELEHEGQIDRDLREQSESAERIERLLEHSIDVPVLAEAVEQQQAADAADTLERLDEAEAAKLLGEMDDTPAAEALAEMEAPLAVGVIEDLIDEGHVKYAAHLLELMAPDDAADLLQEISDQQQASLLSSLPRQVAGDLLQLSTYDAETAGGLMTTDFVTLRENMTIADATTRLREAPIPRGMNHLLVVDEHQKLVGVLGLRQLLIRHPHEVVSTVMKTDVVAVSDDLDREEVARAFDRYDYYMMAVVAENDELLGIVTFDDVIDIIREEQTEDVQRTVGAGKGEMVYSTLGVKLRGRFPWLAINLFTTSCAALIVLQFESLIGRLAILAVIMPVIAAQAGNAGHQSLAVTLRGIVLDEVRRERVWPLIAREALVGLFSGAALGVVIGMFLAVLSHYSIIDGASWQLGVVTGISMALSMACGTLAGVGIPLLMRRVGFDPAMASAIFLVFVTDAVAFATFLGCAFVLSDWLSITT